MGQGWQAAAEDDPFWGLNVPALQGRHKLLPLTFEKVPAAQGAHAAGEDDPREGLLKPGRQSVHEVSADESPKEPAEHG